MDIQDILEVENPAGTAPNAENIADIGNDDIAGADPSAGEDVGDVTTEGTEAEDVSGPPDASGTFEAEKLESGDQDEEEEERVADIDAGDIMMVGDDDIQDVGTDQSENDVTSVQNLEQEDDNSLSLDECQKQDESSAVDDEAEGDENSAVNSVEQADESDVQTLEDGVNLTVGEPGETEQQDKMFGEEDNIDNSENPNEAGVDENDDDFEDQIIETADQENEDTTENEGIETLNVDIQEEAAESPQDAVEQENADTPENEDIETLDDDIQEETAESPQDAVEDTSLNQEDALQQEDSDKDDDIDDNILESVEEENLDTDAKNEDEIHDLDDDSLDIREIEGESDKAERNGETCENELLKPEQSEEQSLSIGEMDTISDSIDNEPDSADIDELDIKEGSVSPGIMKETEADTKDFLNVENDSKNDVEQMDTEMIEEESQQSEKDENVDENSKDAKEEMDVGENDTEELTEMDTETAEGLELPATETEKDMQEEVSPSEEVEIEKAADDHDKSPEVEDEYSEIVEAEEKDKKSEENDAVLEEREESKNMEVDPEVETDGKVEDTLKSEPGEAQTTDPLTDERQETTKPNAKETTAISEVEELKIKKEAVEEGTTTATDKMENVQRIRGRFSTKQQIKARSMHLQTLKKIYTQREQTENSKDPAPVGSESDSSMGLKIVGVTSAVGVNEKGDAETKGVDCSELNLKISAVTGAGDTEEKKEATDEKVEVKEENEKTEKPDKTEKDITKDKESDDKRASKSEAKADDDDVIAIKEEKKPAPKVKASKIQKCIVCSKVGKCKYNIVRNGDVKHLCDDTCFKRFRSSPTTYLKHAETAAQSQDKTQQNNTSSTIAQKAPATAAALKSNQVPPQPYKTCNVCQLMNVRTSKPFLNWQGLDFCGEECLGKFQGGLSVTCSYCSSHIHQTNKAKYCWRVGSEVKHFCSSTCNNEFVKRMKLCAFCNKDLAAVGDSFMAPVGDKGTFKDFCSQKCLQNFEEKNTKDLATAGMENGKASQPPKGNFLCAVCGKTGPVKHELKHDGKTNRLCSDPCFSAFQYANKLTINPCFNCSTSCQTDNQTSQFIQFEGQQKRFCSFMCVNTFRNKFRKTVPCAWCGAKKNNFDMIERVDANNKYQLFCSLNCLSLYRVNLQATSNQAVVCDQCKKFVPAQYHLTMSDASVRNFCSYGCVMQFQAQFQTPKSSQPSISSNQASKQTYTTPPQPQTTTRSGRVVKGSLAVQQQKEASKPTARGNKSNSDSFPIISNVVSLAPKGTQQQINIKSSTGVTVTDQQGIKTTTTTTGNQTVQQQIIIQPPPPKSVKNKSLLCKPFVQTKATSCRPHTQTKETQTDGKIEPDKYLVPVPVPVYCPTPLPMYSLPTPVLVPVPIPIPIPVFIPTTKKSTASILKQIKEIQEKIPADPLEAELLMMAEAVAGKEEESSSDSDDGGETEVAPVKEPPNPPQGGDLGEDMLQMALRMASEMSDEPVMDLETSLEPVAVSTVPPPAPAPAPVETSPSMEDEDDYVPAGQRQTRRSRSSSNKRVSRSTPRRNAKRLKTEIQPEYHEPTPSPPQPAAPPLDANFHLKYTYGVNAFKHWVMQKNAAIEQQGKPNAGRGGPKTFKLDILQCTADELNHSLCLFVKEVRKPNGEMYAVDSIYYLTLGIQQYLFENGRIDNIFTDIYYERFTECLNELLTRYEPKLNHAGQLVCRIEEEHLWESKQLGAHSPYVLLNSLVYFNTKFFMLKTSEDHLKLSFTHIMKHWKKNPSGRGSGTGPNQGRSVYLRYYCPTPQGKGSDANQKKKKEEMPVYEQTENLDNPLRCPVKLYEFYLSKCPESIKNRNDTFYLVPERSCVPDSPVWYSTAMLGIDQMAKMLNRIRLVREIQEAHLHTQPIYI